jgi:hypothetical protein
LLEDPKDQSALYHLVLALRKTDDKTEIPELLKRLAKARQDAATEEAEQNRYKLVIETRRRFQVADARDDLALFAGA